LLAVKALIDEGFQQLELNRVQARVATDNHRSRLVVRRLSFEMVCEHVGSVALDSHPESFQFEPNGDRVYVNVPKQFGIAVVDRQKRAVVAKWGSGVQFENYPMALDDAHKRLFVGCRLPAKLVVLDTTSGRIVANFPTIGDTDDIFYDGGRQVVYVIGVKGRWKFSGSVIPIITNQRDAGISRCRSMTIFWEALITDSGTPSNRNAWRVKR
jgi:hypothetical protein